MRKASKITFVFHQHFTSIVKIDSIIWSFCHEWQKEIGAKAAHENVVEIYY